ncbi:folylpolyglutamate synthase/dihydrofolate synthase family protein [Flavobacteriaceae bacterium S356]|uniref:Dihydrofolate synthase/folylpolyglutamate synthase n=1 Tax=Asprobacillus argus TaxID=3076534 RepID=A0ABU3LIP1_9FLAO|nr:folylpolyglutamate synthase/dihydrofolate synthase family protein [Flavobacteriaceae bacterium S356]
MNYQDTLDWMFSQLPMYQRQGVAAFKKDLTNILAFSKELGFPERQFKSIHVGGTNGKGSTSHMMASILQEAGYNVGLYTSPHLKNFTERIRINGVEVPRDYVVDFINDYKSFLEQQGLSFFEMTVGMAFSYFAKESVDIAIIEVGLGGRLDSTNIIAPEVSVITNIGYDHTQFLGETLPEIAYEKAGIIKENTPVVIGEEQEEVMPVFKRKADSVNAKIDVASDYDFDYSTDLLGACQSKNLKTAVATLKRVQGFTISEDHIEEGLKKVAQNTKLKGRWQILQQRPKVICDTAHNSEGLQYVVKQLGQEDFDNLHIVLGMVNDKKLDSVLRFFPKGATYYFCKPDIPRGLDQRELRKKSEGYNLLGSDYESVKEAYEAALNKAVESDLLYIGGSTFVVAEVI